MPLFLVRWRTTASAFEPSTLLTGDATLVVEPCIRRTATTGDCLQWREAVSYGRNLEKVDVVWRSTRTDVVVRTQASSDLTAETLDGRRPTITGIRMPCVAVPGNSRVVAISVAMRRPGRSRECLPARQQRRERRRPRLLIFALTERTAEASGRLDEVR